MGTTNKNTEDLLSTIRRNKKLAGEDYMKASDFFQAPDFTGADVVDNQHLNVGNASYETLGSQPIFVGRGGLTPRSSRATRQGSMDSAALKAKLYNAAVDEKKKEAADKANEGLNKLKADDKEVPMQYNMDYQMEALDTVAKYRKLAEADPSFPGPTDALNDLSNPNGKYGSQMQKELVAHKVYGENLNQAAKVSTEIEKNLAEGNFVPDGLREANRRFNAGEMKGQAAQQIALDMTAMSAMKNLMPELNAFSASFDATKTATGFHYVNEKNVAPEARGIVRKNVEGGLKPVLTRALGVAENATEDEMTAALTRQVVKKHATQQDPASGNGGGAGSGQHARFTWDKADLPNAETAKKLAESKSPYVHRGYSFQYLSSGGETPPTKSWDFQYAVDPESGAVLDGGEITGSLAGVNPVFNDKTKKLEWMAIISDPAHKETVTNYYKDNKQVAPGTAGATPLEEEVSIPEQTVAIPYDENKNKIEVHTRDKHGENGFSLSEEDYGRVKTVNQKTSGSSSAPKEGDERAVQGGTAIYKSGKWVMK